MYHQNFPSKLLEDTVEEFSKLPGIGKRTALRLVLHLLKQDKEDAVNLGKAIIQLCDEIKTCKICHNLSDKEICNICSDNKRNPSVICVVENARDIMSIENTHQFNGLYHTLGGIISPIDGIGPNDLNISSLEERIKNSDIKEVILALSTTIEGDTTNFYLFKRFKNYNIKVTTLARGVSIGDDLEYIDEITLGKSIVNRVVFNADHS